MANDERANSRGEEDTAKAAHSAPRRRNGRQQACEPCSRRKVACDHQLPICSRCRKSRIPRQCIYLPNRRDVAHGEEPLRNGRHIARHAGIESVGDSSLAVTTRGKGGAAAAAAAAVDVDDGSLGKSPTSRSSRANRRDETGYLGATSFSAIYKETESSLLLSTTPTRRDEDLDDNQVPRVSVPLAEENEGPQQQQQQKSLQSSTDKATIQRGVKVLQQIPGRDASTILFKGYQNPNRGWCQLAAEQLHESLWTRFDHILDVSNAKDRHLTDMADTIQRNTSRAWAEDESKPDDWFSAYSGVNMRWESLGLLFVYWASGALYAAPGFVVGSSKIITEPDRIKLRIQMKDAAWQCAELAKRERSYNSLTLWVLWKQAVLESMISGDASVETWRLHGEIVALTTYLGLHVSPAPADSLSVSVQIRRRILAEIYKIDKVAALFTDRPPLLCARHITTPLPLDISDDELMGVVPLAPQSLDVNGWSLQSHDSDGRVGGSRQEVGILRARTMIARVGEGILDFTLQEKDGQDPKGRLLHLRQQELDTYAQLPARIVYQQGDAKNMSLDGTVLYTKLLVQLEHLQNLFLIDRLLSRQNDEHKSSRRNLIEISYQMVTLTLVFWTYQNRLGYLQHDNEWVVMQYAAPGGGILCMELLRPSGELCARQSQQHQYRRQPTSPKPPRLSMTRSDAVQQLSLLVGFLDSIDATAANGKLCSNVKKIIQHTLDVVLDTGMQSGEGAGRRHREAAQAHGGHGSRRQDNYGSAHLAVNGPDYDELGRLDSMTANWDPDVLGLDWGEMFNSDLLDTFDWLRPEAGDTMQ